MKSNNVTVQYLSLYQLWVGSDILFYQVYSYYYSSPFLLKVFQLTVLFLICIFTPGRRQSKIVILLRNVDQKSLETEFLNAICCPFGDKSQSKRLFLAIFDPRSSIVKSLFDCHLPTATIFGLLLEWVDPINMHTMNPINPFKTNGIFHSDANS